MKSPEPQVTPLDPPVGVAERPDTRGRSRGAAPDLFGEPAQRGRLRECTDPTVAAVGPPGVVGELEDVVGRLLVGMCREQRPDDLRAAASAA